MSRIIILSDLTEWNSGYNNRYIGPYVVASHLETAGFDTFVIDFFTRFPDMPNSIDQFLTDDTLAVCISTTFLSQLKTTESRNQNTSGYFKSWNLWCESSEDLKDWFSDLRETMNSVCPEAKIIIGGGRCELLYKVPEMNLSEHPYMHVDYAVVGLGDLSMPSLMKDIETTGKHSRKNKDILVTKKNNVNFVFPRTEYKKCPVTNYQEKWAIMPNEGLPIEVSRGCVYNCKFCHYDKKESIRKPVNELREEFIRNYEMFGTTHYHFCDDCFNDTKPKVMEVCNTILSLPFKINWISYARVDLAVKFPETMEIMMESGAKGLSFGIETFNYEAGRAAGKGCPPDKVKQMLVETRQKYKEQCLYHGTFITGLPHETIESQQETIEWLAVNDALDFASFDALGIP